MDVRQLIPRIRRAIDGPTADSEVATSVTLSNDQVKDLAADAIANLIFYSGGTWGYTLTVTETDDDTGFPSEYDVAPDLDLAPQTLVVAQAALDYFFHEFRDKKVQETIANEARSWTYQLSANLLLEQFRFLQKMRDGALEQIIQNASGLVSYTSFLAVRDACVSRYIEPYVDSNLAIGGLESDFRFLTAPGL